MRGWSGAVPLSGPASPASTATRGSARSSQRGNHQLAFPSKSMSEGTMALRISTASMRIPPARPRPNSLMTPDVAEHERAEDQDHDQRGRRDRPAGSGQAFA